jgi:hypothetical protein
LRPKPQPKNFLFFLALSVLEMSETSIVNATDRPSYTNSIGNKSLSLNFFYALKLCCRECNQIVLICSV